MLIDPARVLAAVCLNEDGLVPVIAKDASSHAILMLAWMNREALERTLATGQVTYYSRSRQCLWRKGETSGNTQELKSIAIDCDGDALMVEVDQCGPACHTGQPSCFYRQQASDGTEKGW